MTIIAPAAAIDYTELDGVPITTLGTCLETPSPVSIGSSGWAWVECLLPDPPDSPATGEEHSIDCKDDIGDPVPCAVYVYGQREGGAYAYPASLGF